MTHLHLFLGFFRVGILGYGGGPSSIPLVHKEVVEKYKWMDDDEFADILALGNSLPGPIATKMAGYIGFRVAGWLGVINAVLSTILPSIIAMIFLLVSISSFKNEPWVQGMTNAVVPVVGVLLGVLTWDFFKKSNKTLGWKKSIGLVILSLLFISILQFHPAILIVGLLLFVILKKDKKHSERGESK